MTSADRLSVLAATERNAFETLLMEFDQAWNPELLPDYFGQLQTDASDTYRRLALSELVKIDLQRRWSIGQGRMLEEYIRDFPLLGSTETLEPELILIEFAARKSLDANMQLESYSDRYPQQYGDLVRLATLSLGSAPGSTVKPAQASIETSRIGNIQETKAPTKPVDVGVPVEFGRYRILRELGAGAMGTVHLAHDTQLDRQVALKTPSFQSENEAEMVMRFYREARAAAKIQHRNICPIYDVGEIDGQHFITMAFIKGRTMSELIKPDKLPPPKTSAVLIHRLALALAEAHRHNVIHRDLKPANIMIDKKREPVVMDFGLARQTDVESRMTQSGMLLGTPAYMSPEQLSGNPDDVGAQSDIYALGVILYELLTGKLPFNGTLAQVVCQILQEEPKPPSQIREKVSRELESICAKMMAKNRDERYQSMDEVAIAIKKHITGSKEKQSQGKPAGSKHSQPKSRSKPGESVSETGVLNEFFAAQAASDPLQTSNESLPSQSPIPMAVPLKSSVAQSKTSVQIKPARPKPSSGKDFFNGKVKWIAAGLAGAFLVAAVMGIVFFFKTPYGTIRVETFGNLQGLEVLVDGNTVSLTDSKRAKASGHELELKLGGAHLKLDPETNQFIITENGTEKRLTVSVQDVQLASNSFTVTRNKETVLKIELLPNDAVVTTTDKANAPRNNDPTVVANAPRTPLATAPRTPLPSGPAGEVLVLSGHSKSVCGLEFTADGRHLVSNSQDKTIRVWDLAGGQQLRSMPFTRGARDLAVSPTDPWVAVCGTHGRVEILNWATGKLLQILSNANGLYMGVDFSPDGKRVIATNLSKVGKLWDARTGELLFNFATKAPDNAECDVRFLPNGKQFLVAPFSVPTGIVQLFDVKDCKHITDLKIGQKVPGKIAISPSGKRFVSGSFNGSVTLYDLVEQKKIIAINVGGGANSVAWSPDGQWIAVGHEHATHIIDSKSLVLKQKFTHRESGTSVVCFSPDSQFLATGHWGGQIKVWRVNDKTSAVIAPPKQPDLADRTNEKSVPSANAPEPGYISLFNGKDLAGWSLGTSDITQDLSRRPWKAKKGELIVDEEDNTWLITDQEFQDFEFRFEFQFSPNSNAPGSVYGNALNVLVRTAGPHILPAKGLESWQRRMTATAKQAIKNRGNRVFLHPIGIQYSIRAGTLETFGTSIEHQHPIDHKPFNRLSRAQSISTPILANSGSWNTCSVICLGESISVKVNSELVNEATGLKIVPGKIGFKQDNGTGKFRNIYVRKLHATSPKTVFTAPVDEATGYDKRNNYAVAFSPTGEIVDTANEAGTLRIRDVGTGDITPSPIDRRGVSAVAWSNDGSLLALGIKRGKIEVWKDGAAEPTYTFQVPSERTVRSVAFSPDDSVLIALGAESGMFVSSWSLEDGSLLANIDVKNNGVLVNRRVFGSDMNSDGSLVALASGYGVQIWSWKDNQLLRTIVAEGASDKKYGVGPVGFSKDDKRIFWADSRHLRIAEVATGEILHEIVSSGKIYSVAFSPNGKQVVTCSNVFKNTTGKNGVVKRVDTQHFEIWDKDTGTQLRKWSCPGGFYTRHLVFSADGRYLAAAGYGFPLHVWDMEKETGN